MSNKVTYYREVKASERLPDSKKMPTIATIEEDGRPGVCFSEALITKDTWLEPIDITEEEIRKIPYQIAETFGGGLYGDYFKASKLTIEMLLSRLKGE